MPPKYRRQVITSDATEGGAALFGKATHLQNNPVPDADLLVKLAEPFPIPYYLQSLSSSPWKYVHTKYIGCHLQQKSHIFPLRNLRTYSLLMYPE